MKKPFKKTGHFIRHRGIIALHHQRVVNGRWTTDRWTYRDYEAPSLQELLTLI